MLLIVVLSVLTIGIVYYILTIGQIRDNAYFLLNDTVHQTNTFINEKLSEIFDQLIVIENSSSFNNILRADSVLNNENNKYENIIEISKMFNSVYDRYYKIIDSIYLKLNDGKIYKIIRNSILTDDEINLAEWVNTYSWNAKGYYWLNDHKDNVLTTIDTRNVISVFKIIGDSNSRVNGILMINLKSNYFLDILNNSRISTNGYIALMSSDSILSSKDISDSYSIGKNGYDYLIENMGIQGSFDIINNSGEKMLVIYDSLEINKWVVAAIVPYRDIYQNVNKLRIIIPIITILLIFISTVISTIFTNSISKPIRFLAKQVTRVENGEFDLCFNVNDSSEIGLLAQGLDNLVKTVRKLLDQVKDEQEKKRQAELEVLQSQINPHFLYNTMGSIRHLIDMNENLKASQMTSALTKFFMIGLNKGSEIITLNEEIEHVRNYILIQKMRYSKKFDYYFDISDEILDCKIIKLTFQPIVENSIYHGIKNKLNKGSIKISGRKEKDNIVIDISDDGIGISEENLKNLRESIDSSIKSRDSTAFGLRNVNERIKLHFGNNYGVEIKSKYGEFTVVTIKIPYYIF